MVHSQVQQPLTSHFPNTNLERVKSKDTKPTIGSAPVGKEKGPNMANNSKKEALQDPPERIYNSQTGIEYIRGKYLGEGGFARVWSFTSPSGTLHAAKTVPKSTMSNANKKTKLYVEIKVHQLLQHPNICRFDDVFQDDKNVYIMLEVCGGGNMMELLKSRKRYTEPEARPLLVQILSAISYMHTQANVMHRDLKLGNLFLDENMNVKVGDFGLAAVVEREGDRRRTMCGTPNYIAPEVIMKKAKGHSYEVDIWGIGVILYTMLIGKPPFQCNQVNDIYAKIKTLDYSFPEARPISPEARHLIESILTTDPKLRPTLSEILADPWFTCGPFPSRLPKLVPGRYEDFANLSPEQSLSNFEYAKQRARFGCNLPINLPKPSLEKFKNAMEARKALGGQIEEQEKEYQRAVHPDTPISALLLSARKAPIVPPVHLSRDPPPIMGRLQSVGGSTGAHSRSPLRREIKPTSKARTAGRLALAEQDEDGDDDEDDDMEDEEEDARLAGKKPSRLPSSPIPAKHVLSPSTVRANQRLAPTLGGAGAYLVSPRKVSRVRTELKSPGTKAKRGVQGQDGQASAQPVGGEDYYMRIYRNLNDGTALRGQSSIYQHPNMPSNPKAPRIFIASWLDHVQRYGMGFTMTDGSTGVLFNDTSVLTQSANGDYLDHLVPIAAAHSPLESPTYRRDEWETLRAKDEPKLSNRLYLLRHFKDYIAAKLYGGQEYSFKDMDIKHGMTYMAKFWRLRNVVAFRLSNGVMQFNYHDHTKIIISEDGLVITYIDGDYRVWVWNLATLVAAPNPDNVSGREMRRMEAAYRKVDYAREVISKLDRVPSSKSAASKAPKQEQ